MQLTDLDSGSRVIGDERDFDMPEPDHPWAHLWTAEARAEMRKLLSEGARLSRFAKGANIADEESADGFSPVSGERISEWTNAIDRLTRWNVFLTHVNLNCHEVVDTITGGVLSHDSTQFMHLRAKVSENTRTYKNHTLALMEVCLRTISTTISKLIICLVSH